MVSLSQIINKYKYGDLLWHIKDKESYLEFNDFESAEKWGEQIYGDWAKKYTHCMQAAENYIDNSLLTIPVDDYCGYGYKNINKFLRTGEDNNKHFYRELSHILSLTLCAAPRIPCNLILYRLVDDNFINSLIYHNKPNLQTPIKEKGFMSTSLLKSITKTNEPYTGRKNLLKIFAQKGTVGIYVNCIASRNEAEILLPPNMYLGLVEYPYKDKESDKIIYECELFNNQII